VSLPALERKGFGAVSRLPVSLRIVLESLARNVDGRRVTEEDVRALASWRPRAERAREIPFIVARVLLQDFTGVPLIADLAAMRSAMARLGRDPSRSSRSIWSWTTRSRWTPSPRPARSSGTSSWSSTGTARGMSS
jgi:aconitase A